MLILSRKKDQGVSVGVDVPELLEELGLPISDELRERCAERGTLKLMDLMIVEEKRPWGGRAAKLRLGFEAPRALQFLRDELGPPWKANGAEHAA